MAEFAARLGISPGEFAVVREQMCGRLAADLIDDVAYLRLIVSRLAASSPDCNLTDEVVDPDSPCWS
jgi:hypothetical protein